MNSTTKDLDSNELFHLALDASKQNKNEDAIRLLKQALDIDSENGKIHYMLGAMYAEIGMYDRAIASMTDAVKYDPQLYTAHFQLGLLYITSGLIEEARKAWEPLNELSEDNPLYLFKLGMLELVEDNFEDCIALLEKGIKLNQENIPLNNDMRRIISQAKDAINSSFPPDEPDKGDTTNPNPFFMNAYQDDDFNPKS